MIAAELQEQINQFTNQLSASTALCDVTNDDNLRFDGSLSVAIATVAILKRIVSQASWSSANDLMQIVRAEGEWWEGKGADFIRSQSASVPMGGEMFQKYNTDSYALGGERRVSIFWPVFENFWAFCCNFWAKSEQFQVLSGEFKRFQQSYCNFQR